VGQWFPRDDRSPAIVPVAEARMRDAIGGDPRLEGWRIGRSERIQRGFYTSQAMELNHL
jgi:magnesium-protoporphyrin O-methyltransferase